MGAELLHADAARQACRLRVLDQLARQYLVARLVLIEAQAGQGKTTAATQFFARQGVSPTWYTLNPSDQDPVIFLAGLYKALVRSLSDFRIPVLEEMLEKGAISPADYPRVVTMILTGLSGCQGHNLYLVFDDIHQLDAGGATADILRRLTVSAPPDLKLLMLSRQPILPALGLASGDIPAGLVGNADLAFTAAEIGELYTGVLGVPIATADVRRLSQLTEGWAMGLVLVAPELEAGRQLQAIPDAPLDLLRNGQVPDYFRAQLVDSLSRSERQNLYVLALLDTIPPELAAELAPELDLAALAKRNLFLRKMADASGFYAFHHLFHQSLRRLAESELSPQRHYQALQQAAHWHRARRNGEAALGYLLRARDYEGANSLARDDGMDLLARNHVVLLHELLHGLPDQILREFPWLGYVLGLSLLSKDPLRAHDYLDAARIEFHRCGDGSGELLAISQLMYFHIAVDTQYNRLEPLLDRADDLFERHAETLSVPMRVECAQYISYANNHTDRDRAKAAEYSAFALRLAERHELHNAVAMIVCNQAYEASFRGDWPAFARAMDYAYPLQDSPRVTAFAKFIIHFAQINLLSASGDFFNYRRKVKTLKRMLSDDLLNGTLCKPFMYVYEIDMAIAEGRITEAHELVNEALDGGHATFSAHFRSQYLQYGACVAAIRGDWAGVERDASESLRLRREVGHPYHAQKASVIIGGAYARLGDRPQAMQHLNAVLDYVDRQDGKCLATGACFYIAWLELLNDRHEPALAALDQGLQRMRVNEYLSFISWEPQMMERLLSLAVVEGIETDYARRLASERLGLAILHDGKTVPLLEVRTLGGLALVAGDIVVDGIVFTPNQRELLAMLAAAPDATLAYDEIQLVLWPEGSPQKVRARLDTLIARLRKVLTRVFDGTSGAHYLVTEKKNLRLINCHIDAGAFIRYAKLGLVRAQRKNYWQAANAFHVAHSYWRGPFPGGNTLLDQYSEKLRLLYRDSVLEQVRTLMLGGEQKEALDLATTAVSYQPTDEQLVALVYRLHTGAGDAAQALKVVREYETALRSDDYSEDDIADMCECFWTRV